MQIFLTIILTITLWINNFMLNKVFLIGNVGVEPEIRDLPNGSSVANFSLATTDYWKDKSGERQSKTEWHRIKVYQENLIKLVKSYISKGSKIYVEGTIKYRKYTDQEGKEKISTEIVVDYNSTIKLLDSKGSSGIGQGQESIGENRGTGSDNLNSFDSEAINQEGDEIPF